ncbi:unnamed protein product [Ambrosiozyma monospora]|uniref:Uracil-DNA glycosylase n=1 Tax=Ambrosiozyma monospora TaxID=43982 RepID=A0A9W7DFW8_AMBMO|nr:unnamed protein product [Ambrosiozyma monospora]
MTTSESKKRSITDFFSVSKKQKSTPSNATPASSKKTSSPVKAIKHHAQQPTLSTFNKQKWVDSLTAEQKELLDLEINTLDESWLAVLYTELTKTYFLDLKRFLKREWSTPNNVIFPPQEDIYSWSRLTPLSKVKVFIVGQDPYHNYNQAHGLAFSVKDPNTRTPPSLVNIYKCLKKDYPDFEIPKTADLTRWTEEGVLLLNTCLTVRAHKANSHSKRGWETFTTTVLKKLIEYKNNNLNEGLVIVAWGSPAQKTVMNLGDFKKLQEKNLYLKSVHPSPLSASRGYFDCKHFIKCNEWLLEHYGGDQLVDWALVPGNVIKDIQDKKQSHQKENDDARKLTNLE